MRKEITLRPQDLAPPQAAVKALDLDRISTALAASTRPSEVKPLRDQAQAVVDILGAQLPNERDPEKAREIFRMMNQAAGVKLKAERRLGEMLLAMEKNRGGRPVEGNPQRAVAGSQTLADLGFNRTQASKWQRIATIPEPDFERFLVESTEKGIEISTGLALTLAPKRAKPQRPPADPLAKLPRHEMARLRRAISDAVREWARENRPLAAAALRRIADDWDSRM